MKGKRLAIILGILAFILAAIVIALLFLHPPASSQPDTESEPTGLRSQNSAAPKDRHTIDNHNDGGFGQEKQKRNNAASFPKPLARPTSGLDHTAEIQHDSQYNFLIQAVLYLALSLSFVAILAYGFWHQVRVDRGFRERGEAYERVRAQADALSRVLQYAIFAENTAGEILMINGRFCELVGLKQNPKYLIGALAKGMRKQAGSNAAAVWQAIDSIAQQKSPLKEKQISLNEQSYWLTIEPILLEKKTKIGSLWVFRPRTDAIKNEDPDRQVPRQVPKVQLWQEKMPIGPWAPEEFHRHLPWTASFEYTDAYSQAHEGLPGWSLVGATRRGRNHAHTGTHRDDAFRWEIGKNFTIVCVADGAGSYKYSRIGAETICRYVCEELSAQLNDSSFQKKLESDRPDPQLLSSEVGRLMTAVVWKGCLDMMEVAQKVKCERKDFRCTFLLAVHCKSASLELILTSQIGDGFIVALHKDGSCERYGASDSGNFSGEVSCFVPDPEVENKAGQIKPVLASEIEALLLCSDGIEDPFFPIEREARSIFCQLYEGVQQKLSGFEKQTLHGRVVGEGGDYQLLQQWLAFEKRGENDDRTLVILYRKPVEISPDILK